MRRGQLVATFTIFCWFLERWCAATCATVLVADIIEQRGIETFGEHLRFDRVVRNAHLDHFGEALNERAVGKRGPCLS